MKSDEILPEHNKVLFVLNSSGVAVPLHVSICFPHIKSFVWVGFADIKRWFKSRISSLGDLWFAQLFYRYYSWNVFYVKDLSLEVYFNSSQFCFQSLSWTLSYTNIHRNTMLSKKFETMNGSLSTRMLVLSFLIQPHYGVTFYMEIT